MSELSEIPEYPDAERLSLAHQAYLDAGGKGGTLSMRKASRIYGVVYSTLRDWINGAVPNAKAWQNKQWLTPGEEDAIAEWLLLLANWGWPVQIDQLWKMAIELLRAKGDTSELGLYWQDSFLSRHLELKKRFVVGLDKE